MIVAKFLIPTHEQASAKKQISFSSIPLYD